MATWNALTPSNKDSLGLYTGVGMWVNLTTGNPRQLATFLAQACDLFLHCECGFTGAYRVVFHG